MEYQLEITTRCNYSCNYCAGRQMPQADMEWSTFVEIIDSIPTPSIITLQGEGEPTLHPLFWPMVDYATKKQHSVRTTLNGTQLDTTQIPKYFKEINISIDSLDEELCNEIGRVNLPKVLKNISDLCAVYPASSITIRTVDFNQPLGALREYVHSNNFKWRVQPIQRKEDYTSTYKNQFIEVVSANKPRTTLCSYLKQDKLRYYTFTGLELPCCFIKDTAGISTIDRMKHVMPRGCNGCDR